MAEDPGKPPLVMDKAWIKKFLDVDIADFQSELKKILTDQVPADLIATILSAFTTGSLDDVIPTVSTLQEDGEKPDYVLSGSTWPLVIGNMAGSATVHGKAVTGGVTAMAATLTGILEDQQTLFDDIEDNLRDAMDTLFKAQGDSLDKVDGEKLLDAFEDVDDDLTGGEGEDKDS